jgi:hypothetical protein
MPQVRCFHGHRPGLVANYFFLHTDRNTGCDERSRCQTSAAQPVCWRSGRVVQACNNSLPRCSYQEKKKVFSSGVGPADLYIQDKKRATPRTAPSGGRGQDRVCFVCSVALRC